MRREPEELVVWCDGNCETEDGERVARYAFVVLRGREEVGAGAGEVGRGLEMTANVAEYAAVLRALEHAVSAGHGGQAIRVRSDSRVVMLQLGMLCAVRSPRLLPWWWRVRKAARAFAEVHWEWVPRAWNREADARVRERARAARSTGETS